MKRSHLILLGLLLASFVGIKLWQYHWSTATVMLRGETLSVLVAKTGHQHERGLGQRESLAPYEGMLFLFDLPKEYVFIMRDMAFPIDIVWFNEGKVVDIAPSVQPEPGVPVERLKRYIPRKPATIVLELPAGWAASHNLKLGDTLQVVEE